MENNDEPSLKSSTSPVEINAKFEHFPQIKALRDLINRNTNSNVKSSFTNALLREYSKASKKKSKDLNNNNVDFEFVIENQRGMKFFGIPLFSSKSLLPVLDPPSFQSISGQYVLQAVEKDNHNESVHTSLANLYPLPDLDWEWTWDSWYVFMLYDVDDQGWIYSNIRFGSKYWKGKYYFGNFVRRRIWVRLRNRKGFKVQGHQNDHINSLMGNNHEIEVIENYPEGSTLLVGTAA